LRMAVVLGSDQGLSTAAYTKTANLITGTYEFLGKGKITVAVKGSAIGMTATLIVGGVTIIADQNLPYIGTTGTLSLSDNVMASQMMNGGRVEFYLRNTTVGALTTDYLVVFDPA
jgi:hypothetical protein